MYKDKIKDDGLLTEEASTDVKMGKASQLVVNSAKTATLNVKKGINTGAIGIAEGLDYMYKNQIKANEGIEKTFVSTETLNRWQEVNNLTIEKLKRENKILGQEVSQNLQGFTNPVIKTTNWFVGGSIGEMADWRKATLIAITGNAMGKIFPKAGLGVEMLGEAVEEMATDVIFDQDITSEDYDIQQTLQAGLFGAGAGAGLSVLGSGASKAFKMISKNPKMAVKTEINKAKDKVTDDLNSKDEDTIRYSAIINMSKDINDNATVTGVIRTEEQVLGQLGVNQDVLTKAETEKRAEIESQKKVALDEVETQIGALETEKGETEKVYSGKGIDNDIIGKQNELVELKKINEDPEVAKEVGELQKQLDDLGLKETDKKVNIKKIKKNKVEIDKLQKQLDDVKAEQSQAKALRKRSKKKQSKKSQLEEDRKFDKKIKDLEERIAKSEKADLDRQSAIDTNEKIKKAEKINRQLEPHTKRTNRIKELEDDLEGQRNKATRDDTRIKEINKTLEELRARRETLLPKEVETIKTINERIDEILKLEKANEYSENPSYYFDITPEGVAQYYNTNYETQATLNRPTVKTYEEATIESLFEGGEGARIEYGGATEAYEGMFLRQDVTENLVVKEILRDTIGESEIESARRIAENDRKYTRSVIKEIKKNNPEMGVDEVADATKEIILEENGIDKTTDSILQDELISMIDQEMDNAIDIDKLARESGYGYEDIENIYYEDFTREEISEAERKRQQEAYDLFEQEENYATNFIEDRLRILKGRFEENAISNLEGELTDLGNELDSVQQTYDNALKEKKKTKKESQERKDMEILISELRTERKRIKNDIKRTELWLTKAKYNANQVANLEIAKEGKIKADEVKAKEIDEELAKVLDEVEAIKSSEEVSKFLNELRIKDENSRKEIWNQTEKDFAEEIAKNEKLRKDFIEKYNSLDETTKQKFLDEVNELIGFAKEEIEKMRKKIPEKAKIDGYIEKYDNNRIEYQEDTKITDVKKNGIKKEGYQEEIALGSKRPKKQYVISLKDGYGYGEGKQSFIIRDTKTQAHKELKNVQKKAKNNEFNKNKLEKAKKESKKLSTGISMNKGSTESYLTSLINVAMYKIVNPEVKVKEIPIEERVNLDEYEINKNGDEKVISNFNGRVKARDFAIEQVKKIENVPNINPITLKVVKGKVGIIENGMRRAIENNPETFIKKTDVKKPEVTETKVEETPKKVEETPKKVEENSKKYTENLDKIGKLKKAISDNSEESTILYDEEIELENKIKTQRNKVSSAHNRWQDLIKMGVSKVEIENAKIKYERLNKRLKDYEQLLKETETKFARINKHSQDVAKEINKLEIENDSLKESGIKREVEEGYDKELDLTSKEKTLLSAFRNRGLSEEGLRGRIANNVRYNKLNEEYSQLLETQRGVDGIDNVALESDIKGYGETSNKEMIKTLAFYKPELRTDIINYLKGDMSLEGKIMKELDNVVKEIGDVNGIEFLNKKQNFLEEQLLRSNIRNKSVIEEELYNTKKELYEINNGEGSSTDVEALETKISDLKELVEKSFLNKQGKEYVNLPSEKRTIINEAREEIELLERMLEDAKTGNPLETKISELEEEHLELENQSREIKINQENADNRITLLREENKKLRADMKKMSKTDDSYDQADMKKADNLNEIKKLNKDSKKLNNDYINKRKEISDKMVEINNARLELAKETGVPKVLAPFEKTIVESNRRHIEDLSEKLDVKVKELEPLQKELDEYKKQLEEIDSNEFSTVEDYKKVVVVKDIVQQDVSEHLQDIEMLENGIEVAREEIEGITGIKEGIGQDTLNIKYDPTEPVSEFNMPNESKFINDTEEVLRPEWKSKKTSNKKATAETFEEHEKRLRKEREIERQKAIKNVAKSTLDTLIAKGNALGNVSKTIAIMKTHFRKNFTEPFENFFNNYKSAMQGAMSQKIDGSVYDSRKIFDEDMDNGNEFEFTKFLLREKGFAETNYTTRFYEAYKNADSEFRKLIKKIREINDVSMSNILDTIGFDQNKIISRGISPETMARITDPITGEFVLEKLSGEEQIGIVDTWVQETADIFENEQDAKDVLYLITGQYKAQSPLSGTALHKFGLFDAMDTLELRQEGGKITSEQKSKLVERYLAGGDLAHERITLWGANAMAINETYGYKPHSTINQIYGSSDGGTVASIRAGELYGSLGLSSKTSSKMFDKFIRNEVGQDLGEVTVMPKTGVEKAIEWVGSFATIGSGILDIVPEVAWQMAKVVVKYPMTNKIKIVGKNAKGFVDSMQIWNEIKKDPNAHPYIRKYIGGHEASALFLIKNSVDDVNGRSNRRTKDLKFETLGEKVKNIANIVKLNTSKWNAIQWQDKVADINSMLFTNAYMDDAFKLGFDEIMSNPKYVNMATALDTHGITKEVFEKMGVYEPNQLGIREFDTTEFSDIELRAVENFMGDLYKQTAFTKSNKSVSNATKDIADPKLRSFVKVLTFFKTTMFNKLFDGYNVAVESNAYAGMGSNFNYKNLNQYGNLGMGLALMYGANLLMDKPEEMWYQYDVDKGQGAFLQLANEMGLYVLTQPSALQRNIGGLTSGNLNRTVKSASNLLIGKLPTRVGSKIIDSLTENE